MKVKIAQIVGLNTDQKAAQVLSQQVDEESFLAVLNLAGDDAFTKGRATLSEVADFYFEQEGTGAEKLTRTFENAAKKFTAEEKFDLLLASISGKILYLIGRGNMEVYLKRSSKLTPLLAIGSSEQIISGFLEEGDRILLATQSLVAFLGSDLESTLGLPLEAFEEEVSAKVGSRPLPAPVGKEDAVEDQSASDEVIEEEFEGEEKSGQKPAPEASEQQAPHEALAALAIDVGSSEEAVGETPAAAEEETAMPADIPSIAQPAESESAITQTSYEETSPSRSAIGGVLGIFKKLGSVLPKSGRGRLIFALILLVIVGAGIGFKYKRNKDKEREAQFNQQMQAARDDFAAAKGLSSLNPADAKGKLDSAKSEVAAALKLEPNNNDAKDLQKRINDEAGSILQESQAKAFPEFLDLDLIKKNFRANQMSLSDGKLLLLDPVVKTLVVIDLAKKSNQILAGSDQLGDAKFANLNGELAFVFSKDKGLLRVDITNSKVITAAKTDKEWGTVSDLYGFGSNIYLLDSGKNQIWKYVPTTDGYSDKREYLTSDTKASLTDSLRMQIESSVYILKKGGEILRFTKGAKDNFSLGGLDKGVKDPKSLFVSSDTDSLYLLDSGNSRLVILTKTGEYKGQVAGDKFASATDLVVDEKGKKVYLLDGGKIYTADLK